MIKVYYKTVVEYESGWGVSPAGYLITLDKTKGTEFASKENGHLCGDYSCFSKVEGDWKLGLLKDEDSIHKFSNPQNTLWVSDECFKALVEI